MIARSWGLATIEACKLAQFRAECNVGTADFRRATYVAAMTLICYPPDISAAANEYQRLAIREIINER